MADTLKQIWADVLGKETSEIQHNSNFFEIGGDSVQAIKLAAKANQEGVKLSSQQVFQNPTFSSMSDIATATQGSFEKDDDGDSHHPRPRSNGLDNARDHLEAYKLVNACLAQCDLHGALLEDILPCTPFQRELMNASHNLGCWTFQAVFQISKNAEARAKQVIEDLHTRNPIFRTRIAQYGTELYQIVSKAPVEWQIHEVPLEVFKATELPKRMQYGSPLSRCAIVNDTSRDEKFIVWSQTHAIYDRWSKMHVLEDVQNAFKDLNAFRKSPVRTPFRDFVGYIESVNVQESIRYWKQQIRDLEHYGQLFDAPPNQQFKTSETQTVRKITSFRKPQNTNITFATISQVAWALVTARECGLNDIFFCSFRSCRQMDLSGIDTIIGPLWSLVPVRMQLNAEHSLEDILQEVHRRMVEGIPHEPYGIIALDEHFGHKGYLQSVLLPQPPQPDTFGMKLTAKDPKTGEEMTLRSAEELWQQTRGHFGLYIMLTPKGEDLELWGRFDENVIDLERVSSLLDKYIDTMNLIYDSSWKETKISSILPDLPIGPRPGGDKSRNLTNGYHEENAEYSLDGIDSNKPATLRYLLNQQSSDALACAIPQKDKTWGITYGDLEKHVQSFQKSLARLGIKKESAVSMSLGNTYELVVAFIATTRQRAIAAPLNPSYKQDEFEFYVDDLSSSLVLVPKGKFNENEPAVKAARKYEAAIAEVSWDPKSSEVYLDVKENGKAKSSISEDNKVLEAEEDDIALVLHTSGTTGRPKAVPLSHKNLITSIDNICTTYHLRPHDRTMLIMPLFHVHGLLASFLSPLRSGGAAIIPERLTPEFWNQFKDSNATWYSATPTMHRMILQFPLPDSGLPDIRFIRSCSSQLAPALFEQLEDKFQAPVLESYAMTEASHMMTSNLLPPGKRYSGSVGQPQNIDLKILDEDGTEVDQGKEAEVCIRGANVTKGYLNNEDANKSSFTKEGFFRTGDQGKIDENGFLVLTGRLKELINKGGEKISPVELDNAISQHEDIAECVSFAIDDEDYGQDVGCAIKLKDGKEEMDVKALKKWISEKVAAHKVPKKVCFPCKSILSTPAYTRLEYQSS